MKHKLTKLDEMKIKILWETGAITQRQLAKVFHCSQSNISRIIQQTEDKQ